MASRAVKKERIKPIARKPSSWELKLSPVLNMSRPVAAIMVGMASKKEYSTAVFLLSPKKSPAMMVAAERETPGIMAVAWKRPIKKAWM